MSSSPYESPGFFKTTLGVFFWPQTYINVFYLLLAFPLGIAYFVILVTGFSVGVGTLIIWAGIPILLLVFLVSWLLTLLERELAVRLLKEPVPAPKGRSWPSKLDDGSQSLAPEERLFVQFWRRVKSHALNPATWTGVVYLLAKFPLGIASFVMTVVLLSVSFSLIATPVHFRWSQTQFGPWKIDTLGESFIPLAAGVLLLLITPHVLNLTAFLSGRFASLVLGLSWGRNSSEQPVNAA